ncbi:MAG TPA: protein kinase [Polyangiaceae bacterium]|nr:protein kinase [Polyangiaceae bacterium]
MPASSPSQQRHLSYAPGDVIAGKYALEELLGEGGMGAVFRARNTSIDMPVALKLIRADLDRELLSGRLLQEARAAAKLAHPAIVRVFDVGKTALGDPFIVMELLQGETLASALDREGRLSSARAVQLLLPIADALAVAHAKGFVHRDVKPDNVFLATDDDGQVQPKLVDFGIVKHEYKEGDSQLTQVGAVLGSPDYMSPEQARGLDNIDLRSDVWSFSVVLYEAITGEAPFEAANYNALLRLIVETEPPTLRERHAADDELSQLVQRGLSKDPADRFASMGLMGKALASWLTEQGVTEDVCGVSLEARWLSRASDAAALARVSRSSSPDSWPEPPSGVRAVSNRLGNAPTVPLAKQAATPHSQAHGPSPLGRQRKLMLAGAALALVVAGALSYSFLGGPSASAPVAATAAQREEQPQQSRQNAELLPETRAAAATMAEPSAPPAPTAQTSASPPAPSRSAPKPAATKDDSLAPAAPKLPAEPAAQPASDLLSPY